MRKFWTVRPNTGYGVGTKNTRENSPDLPAPVGDISWTMPGDIRLAEEGAGAAAHKHLIHGSLAVPSTGSDDHYHWVVQTPAGGIKQVYVGSGTAHNHTGELITINDVDYIQPKFFVLLITCDDAEYTNLTSNGVTNVAERVASEVNGEWVYAPLENTTWGAGKRTAVENFLNNQLGLELPSVVDTDKELIIWLLDFGGWRPEKEDKHN